MSSSTGGGSGVDSVSSWIGGGSGVDSVSSWTGGGSGVDSVSSWNGAGSMLAADGYGLRTEVVLRRGGWSGHLTGYTEGPGKG